MPCFIAFNDSLRCSCRTRHCRMSSFSAFNYSGCTTVVRRGVAIFFCQNKHFLYLQVPGIDIAMDWQVHHPTPNRSIHAPRSAGNTFIHACVVFLPHLHVFLRITLPSSLPFVTHIRGHMARAPLPSPLPCVPSF